MNIKYLTRIISKSQATGYTVLPATAYEAIFFWSISPPSVIQELGCGLWLKKNQLSHNIVHHQGEEQGICIREIKGLNSKAWFCIPAGNVCIECLIISGCQSCRNRTIP